MEKVIVEVGSTVTKVDLYDEIDIKRIKDKTILFKKHYQEKQALDKEDVYLLIDLIKEVKQNYRDIYVCGTSIFRKLYDEERKEFLDIFKRETGCEFHIIVEEEENHLTVEGATRFVHDKVCVMIGGGGSTEIAIYEDKIIEEANTSIGVIDVVNAFPDLAEDIASTSLEEVMAYIKERLKLPKLKADTLILAGGGHEKFARESGITYESNKVYQDNQAPIMMDIDTRRKDTKRYFEEISLDKIRENSNDPAWWDATRAMCAFALVVAEAIEAKVIIPTDISMTYGIVENIDKVNKL